MGFLLGTVGCEIVFHFNPPEVDIHEERLQKRARYNPGKHTSWDVHYVNLRLQTDTHSLIFAFDLRSIRIRVWLYASKVFTSLNEWSVSSHSI